MNEGTVHWIPYVVALFTAIIPANIARGKGRSFWLWYLYGYCLFLVALFHSLSLRHASTLVLPLEEAQQRKLLRPDAAHIDYYIGCLRHEHPRVREVAVDALGLLSWDAERARPELVKATEDPDRRVRSRARWAVERVS